ARGIEPRVVAYLDDPPDLATLRSLLVKLDLSARELARGKESAWTEAGLDDTSDDDAILAAMTRHPILIERPIVVRGERAVLGRPPENVDALLDA
ncbi:MAG: ArsC/Spx/MgsR family protein, partial [Gammaproteobacteria bacterium]